MLSCSFRHLFVQFSTKIISVQNIQISLFARFSSFKRLTILSKSPKTFFRFNYFWLSFSRSYSVFLHRIKSMCTRTYTYLKHTRMNLTPSQPIVVRIRCFLSVRSFHFIVIAVVAMACECVRTTNASIWSLRSKENQTKNGTKKRTDKPLLKFDVRQLQRTLRNTIKHTRRLRVHARKHTFTSIRSFSSG